MRPPSYVKFEARNPKFETILKMRISNVLNSFLISVIRYSDLFRISIFGFRILSKPMIPYFVPCRIMDSISAATLLYLYRTRCYLYPLLPRRRCCSTTHPKRSGVPIGLLEYDKCLPHYPCRQKFSPGLPQWNESLRFCKDRWGQSSSKNPKQDHIRKGPLRCSPPIFGSLPYA